MIVSSDQFTPIPKNRNDRWFALATSVAFFVAVVSLIVAFLLDPEGGITSGASTVMALPWSTFNLRYATSTNAVVALHVLSGAINAAIMYVVIKYVLRTASLQRSLITVLAVAASITTIVWALNGQIRENNIRIVNDRRGIGAWMAIDEIGLKALSETPRMDSAALEELRGHLMFVPNQTRSNHKGQHFLFKGGRPVSPFPTSEIDNSNWVEVEKIRIIEGPSKGREGWVLSGHLKRLLTMFAM